MSVADQITEKLKVLQPIHMELVNESSKHSVPEGSESHFKLLMVSDFFTDKNRVQRQRKVYELLSAELAGPVHALSLKLLTPEEWDGHQTLETPNCHGGDGKLS